MKAIPYERRFRRDKFKCGKAPLDHYILRNATEDVKSGACTCFVILDETDQVVAYYTLSAETISTLEAPEMVRKTFGYPSIPVILLGRLAVHGDMHGKGYGRFLLADALKRSLMVAEQHIGAVAVVVDPIDEEAVRFYRKYGFSSLPDSARMFMTIRKISEAMKKGK